MANPAPPRMADERPIAPPVTGGGSSLCQSLEAQTRLLYRTEPTAGTQRSALPPSPCVTPPAVRWCVLCNALAPALRTPSDPMALEPHSAAPPAARGGQELLALPLLRLCAPRESAPRPAQQTLLKAGCGGAGGARRLRAASPPTHAQHNTRTAQARDLRLRPIPCLACRARPVIWRRRGAKAGFASVQREPFHTAGGLHSHLQEPRTPTYPAPHSAGGNSSSPIQNPKEPQGTAVCKPWHGCSFRHEPNHMSSRRTPGCQTPSPREKALLRMRSDLPPAALAPPKKARERPRTVHTCPATRGAPST